jgi:hypothetical protein
VNGQEKTYRLATGAAQNYAIQNLLKETYHYDLTIDGDTVTSVKETETDFPDYKPQTKPGEQQNIHLRMLKNGATGLEYIPLFVSYQSMFAIFGQNIHVGLISFADAKDFAKECEGIVLGPGVFNKIFTKEMLSEEQ